MASSKSTNNTSLDDEHQSEDGLTLDEYKLVNSLPKETWFANSLCRYQGFWFPCKNGFECVRSFKTHFQSHDTDIVLASLLKSGTTWLKSLAYTIINREKLSNDFSQHPLRTITPHELVSNLEVVLYKNISGNQPDLTKMTSPRLFSTHVPYSLLPDSVKTSKSRIVYICRNPLDNFISFLLFWLQLHVNEDKNLERELIEAHVEKYCKGIVPFGPYEDHLLGFWKESLKNPQKVLFLEYEGLKKEPQAQLKKLAEFVGCPFSEEEEKGNVIDEIIELCRSLKSLKQMEVNKSGKYYPWFENKALFRKGEVGDWTNYLTPSMAKQFDQIQQNLKNGGFSSKFYQV